MKLDKTKHYEQVFGETNVRYIQNGHNFDHNGNLIKSETKKDNTDDTTKRAANTTN